MRKFMLAIFLALGAAFSSEARAIENNGNMLLDDCNLVLRFADGSLDPHVGEAVMLGRCLGLVQGIIKLNEVHRVKGKGSALFCPPSGTTGAQAVHIVVKYMRDNPSELYNEESLVVIAALSDMYPCTGGR